MLLFCCVAIVTIPFACVFDYNTQGRADFQLGVGRVFKLDEPGIAAINQTLTH